MTYQAKYAKPSKGNGAMRLAFVMLCLLMVSVYMMAGLLAKYRTSGDGGDGARVAKFDVRVTGTATDMDIECKEVADTGTYQITVENKSEVAVRYTVTVDIRPVDDAFDPSAITALWDTNSGELAVGAAANKHTLTFSVNDWAAVTKNMNGASGNISFTFTVTVNAEQID